MDETFDLAESSLELPVRSLETLQGGARDHPINICLPVMGVVGHHTCHMRSVEG